MSQSDSLAFFHLKPIRAARVSEISEATAAAPVPDEERVNFHIGNPLQEVQRLQVLTRDVMHLARGQRVGARGHVGDIDELDLVEVRRLVR